jgi:hypothetical protein
MAPSAIVKRLQRFRISVRAIARIVHLLCSLPADRPEVARYTAGGGDWFSTTRRPDAPADRREEIRRCTSTGSTGCESLVKDHVGDETEGHSIPRFTIARLDQQVRQGIGGLASGLQAESERIALA